MSQLLLGIKGKERKMLLSLAICKVIFRDAKQQQQQQQHTMRTKYYQSNWYTQQCFIYSKAMGFFVKLH